MKNCLVFLGNGFDVAHGFKTSYKNFYYNKKKEFLFGAQNGNRLFKHILDKITGSYWQDLEKGLFNYSKELTELFNEGDIIKAKQFEEEFIELKKLLFDYLQDPPLDRMDSSGQTIKKLCDEWLKLDCHVVSFNYTYFAAAYTNDSKKHSSGLSFDSKAITFQHGMVKNPNPYRANSYEDIVVGIDESQKVEALHSFLYKTSQCISNIHQLTQKVQGADVFIIYGCSMGDSDKFYFKNLFDERKQNKRYIVYGYGQEEINRLKKNIRDYTGGLSVFQDEYHNNLVTIIDSSNKTTVIKETRQLINTFLTEP